MKVRVDHRSCVGYGECTTLAPELFEEDDAGLAVAKGDGKVPAGLEEKARESARICPAAAISVEE